MIQRLYPHRFWIAAFALHLICLIALLIETPKPLKIAPPRSMRVQTVALAPKLSSPTTTAPVKQPKPIEKPQKKEKAAKQQKKRVDSDLLASVQKQIDQVNKPVVASKKLAPTAPVIQWKTDQLVSSQESHYLSELSDYLKGQLTLPEYGAVKIELTLKATGALAKWVILSSESSKNRKYVEERLSQLTFPAMSVKTGSNSLTFCITLCNE